MDICFLQQDVRLKNANSWTSLANMSQSGTQQSARKEAVTTSFAQFRKQAKEKEERVCYDFYFLLVFLQYKGRECVPLDGVGLLKYNFVYYSSTNEENVCFLLEMDCLNIILCIIPVLDIIYVFYFINREIDIHTYTFSFCIFNGSVFCHVGCIF